MEENKPSCGRLFGSSVSPLAAAGVSARVPSAAPKESAITTANACEALHRTRRDVSKVPPLAAC
jgi:hypothetical protein